MLVSMPMTLILGFLADRLGGGVQSPGEGAQDAVDEGAGVLSIKNKCEPSVNFCTMWSWTFLGHPFSLGLGEDFQGFFSQVSRESPVNRTEFYFWVPRVQAYFD